jgi:3,4-dihydroxy 2-butanone 4-phosphate synthase / GTP cyclohydrolase II
MNVKRVTASVLPTKLGSFKILGYEAVTQRRKRAYIVLLKERAGRSGIPLVRIHSQCLTGDVFSSVRCDCGDQLRRAMRAIHKEGHGVLIYHPEEGRGIGILNKLRAYELQDQGADTVEANLKLGFGDDERDYSACAEILKDLGFYRVRLLSNNPEKMKALERAGVRVVKLVPIEVPPRRHSHNYLKTKKEKLGHLLTRV